MITYRKARPEEFEAMASFANMVFNHKGDPIQFHRDLTKVYGPGADRRSAADMHTLAVDDALGIRAMIGALPNVLHTQAGDLGVRYIGTVSVHPQARGEGHMKAILPAVLKEAREQGAAIALLGGQRQRYGYFGFVPSGTVWTMTVIPANVRHALGGVQAEDLAWQRVERADRAGAHAAAQLHAKGRIRFDRPEDRFVEICESYAKELWLAERGGDALGYAVTDRAKGEWLEAAATDADALDAMVKSWFSRHGVGALQITFPDWQAEDRLHVARYAEDVSMAPGACACILDPRRVAQTLLAAKAGYARVEDGTLAFDVEGFEPFRLTVEGGAVGTAPCGAAECMKLSAFEMSMLLCCPYPYEGRPEVPGSWFPLPVWAQGPDTF